MAEIDDDYSCEICCEPYSLKNKNKQPKLTNCCSHCFCLSCLLDIYTRNFNTFKCPYCRKSSMKNPKEFETNTKIFSHYLICCHCENRVLQNELFLCLDNGNMDIKCSGCQNGNDFKLIDYLPALLNELESKLGPSFKKVKSNCYREHKHGFYVYAKPNKCDPKVVTKYIGRYLGRPVIATSRIDKYDGENVTFHYNRHEDGVYVEETIPAMEFIERLIRHIPEKHFKMIRYGGIYARMNDIQLKAAV